MINTIILFVQLLISSCLLNENLESKIKSEIEKNEYLQKIKQSEIFQQIVNFVRSSSPVCENPNSLGIFLKIIRDTAISAKNEALKIRTEYIDHKATVKMIRSAWNVVQQCKDAKKACSDKFKEIFHSKRPQSFIKDIDPSDLEL